MKALILDFIRLDESHTGEYLASKLSDCLQAFNIKEKVYVYSLTCVCLTDTTLQVLSIVTDNAANVVKMFSYLDEQQKGRVMLGSTTRVMCILHILNLVCQVRSYPPHITLSLF